jgi:hypothetical protein
MLEHDHADRRQLRDLVAAEPATRSTLAGGELAAAPPTGVRIVIDDLIDLVLRRKLTARTRVPRLAASLALGALAPQQRLRLRARLRTPLLTRLGRI